MKKRFLVFLLICSLTIMGCGNTVSVDSTAGRNETKTSVPSLQKTSTEEKKTSAEPTKDEWEGYQFAFSEKQGFGTYISEDVEYEWDDSNGLTIYAGNKGYIPYVLMFRVSKTSHTPKTYFADYFTPSMQQEYGDRLVEVGETKEYSVGGKKIVGTEYHYLVQDTEVILLRLFEVDNFGTYMEYTAKYVKGEGDETLAVLDDAARNYTTEIAGN
nr:hypothetical protein [Lachnospiraceae bacterium]